MSVNLETSSTKSSDRDSVVERVSRGKISQSAKSSLTVSLTQFENPSEEHTFSFDGTVETDAGHPCGDVVLTKPEEAGAELSNLDFDDESGQKMAKNNSTLSKTPREDLNISLIMSLLKKVSRNSQHSGISDHQTENTSQFIIPPSSPSISVNISEDLVIENRRKTQSSSIFSRGFDEANVVIMTIPEESSEITQQEQEEEEPQQTETPTDITIDRHMYTRMYSHFQRKRHDLKVINTVLQSKMATYFLRRRMFYVLKEQTGRHAQSVGKYERDLEALGELKERCEYERMLLMENVENLRNKRNSKSVELDQLLEKVQRAELDCGRLLTLERTGRENMDKVAERFVKRQRNQAKILSKLRLEYIVLFNRVAEKTRALEGLDKLGPGYHIMDYVQLRQDNRNLHDRLEEKEDELTKIRASCRHTMQILAHNREKFSIMETKIDTQLHRFKELSSDILDAREQLDYLKRERARIREETKQLEMQHGLLTQPKMLRDLDNATSEVEYLQKETEILKDAYYEAQERLLAVRKKIEKNTHGRTRKE